MTTERPAQPPDESARIPDETLAADVARVVNECGAPPSVAEYTERGAYAATTVADRFGDGSWLDALATLGYDPPPRRGQRIDRETLVADVRRVADALGRPPTQQEYAEQGRYAPRTVARRLGDGSWVDALDRLGYEVAHRVVDLSADTLRADVARVAERVGRPPTVVEYQAHGEYAATTISRRFGAGCWADALAALGYDPAARGTETVANADLRAAVVRVGAALDHPPTRADFAARSEYDPQTVANRFGDGLWHDALATLGYDVADRQASNAHARSALRDDLDRVVAERGEVPTAREYDEHGEYAAQTIANRFGGGSWTDALDALGYTRPEPAATSAIPADALREDVRRVVEDLGRTPTIDDYEAAGSYSFRTIANRFGDGSWTDALRELGHK